MANILRVTSFLEEWEFLNLAELLADTKTYTQIVQGKVIQTRNEGFRFEVAASGATDHSMITAGGVKLYVVNSLVFVVDAYGAKGDGVTASAAGAQAAMDACYAAGGGTVLFGHGRYLMEATLVQYDLCVIKGQALATELYLTDGANVDLIKTRDYDTFDGTNSWYVGGDGIPWGYGIRDIMLNGNVANNTSGRGYVGYGKISFMDNVRIINTAGSGILHQCGNTVGQVDHRDLPEAVWDNIFVRDCGSAGLGSDGIILAGPHDSHYIRVIAANNGIDETDWNIVIFGDSNVTGGGRVGKMHTYGSGSGIKITGSNATLQGEHVIAENGLLIETPGSAISIAQCNSSNYGKAIHITSGGNQISMARYGTNAVSHSGLVIESDGNQIDQVRGFCDANGTGINLDVRGSYNQIGKVRLNGMNGVGGIGLSVGAGAVVCNDNSIHSGYLNGSETNFSYPTEGDRNTISINSSHGDETKHFVHGVIGDEDEIRIKSLGSVYNFPPVRIVNTSSGGNSGTGSDTLISSTIKADSFFKTNTVCKVRAWGGTFNSANPKTVTFEFGAGVTVLTQALTPNINGFWEIEAMIISTGSNTQKTVTKVIESGSLISSLQLAETTAVTTNNISIRCRGSVSDAGGGVLDNEITAAGMTVEWVY